ncbi:MAG TPA: beta-N-acetylhexosaminidase [Candidatus Baltobacteraceae bacterium]|jgi:beta-N-acetylhexosaminidase|nr:beta-N-acetylhexosaminidase [Candidatus Baltobacteraceae bacterium]
MTDLRLLASGVICCGFPGVDLDAEVESRLASFQPGGVILFTRNAESVEQTAALTKRIRAILDDPVIGIDQEGGRVMRLRNGVAPVPPMRELASAGAGQVRRTAEQAGSDLRRAGVNLDFAPVIDLAIHDTNAVIGDRSFGSDPAVVAELGDAFAAGLRASGITPVFKHFPGHGSTDADSHFELPVVDESEATLRERDLVPFARLLPTAEAVMTAHMIVTAFDPGLPVTLSPRILTGILRGELGFHGVCFTDCMQMDAIAKTYGSVEGSVAAIGAGADCILVSHSLDLAEQCAQAIAAAAENGTIPLSRLEEAHARVRSLRAALC